MDIAAMSVAMASNQVRADASLAVMTNVKDLAKQQGADLVEMLEQSVDTPKHPALGNTIDIKL